MTGLGRAQITRLIAVYVKTGTVEEKRYRRHRFARRYTSADVALLAEVDEAHETLSGPATRQILQREFEHHGDKGFERLAGISVAHIYNLRKTRGYREKRLRYEKTRPVQLSIGERRRPEPQGKPGYLRVDTVHQGDLDGVKGVYHINAVDEVTQWQVVGATSQISEQWLIPVLEAMLEQFPFRIRGFLSDNGSEFINHTVAQLLNKLLTEQTKSRPRHCNDNGLVESKNAAVIRKHIGYGYIASRHATAMMSFHRGHMNPYLNFQRPCGVPELKTDNKGKATPGIPSLRHTVGVAAASPTVPRLSEAGRNMCAVAIASRPSQRYASRAPLASGQAQVVRRLRTEAERMKTAEEMTVHGRRGKPKAGFLRAHRLWKSLRASTFRRDAAFCVRSGGFINLLSIDALARSLLCWMPSFWRT